MSKPYLQQRNGGTFSFRIAVPLDLRAVLETRELVRTLKTTDRRIAAPRALYLASQALNLFAELRAMPEDKRKCHVLDYTVKFNLNESGHLASVEVQGEAHEQAAINSAIKAAMENAPRPTQVLYGAVPMSVGQSATAQVPALLPPDVVDRGKTLKDVIDKFLNGYRQNKKPEMFKKHKPVLAMFLDVVGDKPIVNLKQADLNDFFELLGRLPPRWKDQCRKHGVGVRELAEMDHPQTLGPKTFDDTYIASIRPFLKAAKKDWQDQGFPLGLTTDGIEYLGDREEDENKQRAFKRDELVRLFEGEEMCRFASQAGQHHRYWILHLGLFTGARVNEICQINPHTDVVQDEESGVWYLWITENTESDSRVRKSVKTGDSRKVPIHYKLIELGFLAYVERVKAGSHKLLFPEWQPINRRASGEAEKWVRQFFRDTNLRDETPKAKILGMHAFRHTLLTYGAMQKPPLSLFCITGHTQDEAPIHATGAGKGYLTLSLLSPLSDRKKMLDKLDYGLDFHSPFTA